MHQPLPPHRESEVPQPDRPAIPLPLGMIALCLLIVVVLWAALLFNIRQSENAAVAQASSDAANMAIAFRENVKRTMSTIDQLMLTVIAENNETGNFYHIPAWVAESPVLRTMNLRVSIANPDGFIIVSNPTRTDRTDISEHPDFRYQLDPAAAEPYVGVPTVSRRSGGWWIRISRRITRPDGSFGGVIAVSIDPFYFSQFFESVDLGKRGVVDLIGNDGVVRARRERGNHAIGQYVGDTPLFKRMQQSSGGSEIVRSKLDGITRAYGFSSVPGYPLVVAVGVAMDDALAAAYRQRDLYYAGGGILTVVILMLGWFLARETRRRRQRGLASIAEEKIREQKTLLEMTLNNMRHGVLMFDQNSQAVVVNRSYVELYRLSPETAKPGCSVRSLLEQRAATGTFAGDPDDYIEKVLVRGRVVDRVFDIPDGRSVRIVNRFMENGWWVSIHEEVTQRRKVEAALEKALAEAERAEKEANAAHSRLRDAFEVVPEGLVLFDAEDRYVMWNRRYAELNPRTPGTVQVGMRFEDALRAGLAEGVYPEARGREAQWLAERLGRHAQANSTHELLLPDERWLRICERRTADGGSVGIRIDISELKQREESVRALFEANPVPMYVFDYESLKFLAVNDAALRQYGYSREQFLTMTTPDIHPPEQRAQYAEKIREFLEAENDRFESIIGWKHRRADGGDILVHVYGRRLNYNDRPAALCSIIDITEQVRAEEERDRNREFLDRIIENVTVTILVKDARTRQYVLINKAAEKLWGLPREAMIGKTPHQLFSQKIADMIEDHDQQLIDSQASFYKPEHRLETPNNGTRLVTSNRIAIRDNKGEVQYLVGVIEDVTERNAVEDQLRQAQKMEAIGNLTGGVAHDFNNLLTVILGNLDLLQEDVAGDAAAEERISVIMQASERGADLTRYMLAFSRRQPLQSKSVDVNALISTAMRLISRTLGANIMVELNTTDTLPPALVDPSQLETALLNIAINARDAMPNGGTLTVATRVADLDEAYAVRHPGFVAGSYVGIEIADTGTGMTPETLDRIFEPFFTTKATGQGTGLGLSMVYGFVKQSGGHINVYSEPGRGTVFKLYLPRAKPAPAKAVEVAAPRATKPAGNEVILAVEDNPDIRATVVRQLRDLGYRVQEADSADAALRILDRAEPIDLLFTDIMPGELNGKDLANRARAKRADLKVLFTSGFPGTSNGHGAELEPGDAFLSKPYHKQDLAKAVARALGTPA